MAISKKDKQELEQCYSDQKELGGRKEDYFPILYLMNKFKCDIKEIQHNVAFGNNDFGIDAFYLDPTFKVEVQQKQKRLQVVFCSPGIFWACC